MKMSAAVAVIAGAALFAETAGVIAQQAPPTAAACVVTGTITGLGGPLPGVAITVRRGDAVQTATSTNIDGAYRITLPDNTYQLQADLTGFDRVQKDVTVSKTDACAQTVDLAMSLTPRTAPAPTATATAAPRGRGAGPGGRAGGAAGANGTGGGFEALTVQQNAAAEGIDFSQLESNQPQQDLTPAGFGSEAVADAFAVTGDSVRVDRGALNDRQRGFNNGEFQLPNFDGRGGDNGGFGGGNTPSLAGLNSGGGFGGNQGNFNQGGGRGGRGGNNNFQLGGRGGRQQRMQYRANYSFSGSALESPKKQLNRAAVSSPPYGNNSYGLQMQGPLKIPGILKNENGTTNVQLSYNGSKGTNLFDQTATVPSEAMRNGDFSSLLTANRQITDPQTGMPFPGNVIPADKITPQAQRLLQYYQAPNLPGDTQNYRYATTTTRSQNQVQVGIRHNFSGQSAGGGRGGGGNNNRQSNAGLAGKGKRLLGTRTNVNMNLNVSFSQSQQDQANLFTALGGSNQSRNYSIQDTFNIQHGRTQHQFGVTYNHTHSQTTNKFSDIFDVSGLPLDQGGLGLSGIATPSSFAWGLPRVSFSAYSGLSDITPNLSNANRASANYTWKRPWRRNHQLQAGGDFRYDVTTTDSEGNANGQFIFNGLYSGNDFADFLLGMPAQASIAGGPGAITLTSKTLGLFFQDDWRIRPSLTAQLGVRYDLFWPFTEKNGHMVNLDVTPDFTAAAPVCAGEVPNTPCVDVGAFTGAFPSGLIHKDKNNISPKLGLAWRAPKRFIIRTSYEVNYNNGTYSAIARQLSQQPPFATTGTNIGSISNLLLMSDALSGISFSDVTNTYGIDKNYVFGTVKQGVVTVQRQLGETWNTTAQYTRTDGSNLDVVRAPNRGVDGLRIEGVQPFTWTSSEGKSRLNAANFGLEKRVSRGFAWTVTYALAKSMDNAPGGTGNGGASSSNIAQNDQDLEAEWARSNFDVRNKVGIQAQLTLPFGPNQRWLYNGGFLATLLERWDFRPSFTWQSGNPLTITVRNARGDVSSGITGARRANYNGLPLTVADPSVTGWFNTDAFTIPSDNQFGNSPRNIVEGPGSKNLNFRLQRSVQLGNNRSASININVNDVLNMTNYSGVDTNINSLTFGQITGLSGNRRGTLSLTFSF
jgi:hypothetical protein